MNDVDLIPFHKQIIDKAIADYKPRAIVLMLSGGDDSLAASVMCKLLGVKIDYVIHGWTRTGIKETTDFAVKIADQMGYPYLIADAGTSYVDYVMRKGFFGHGIQAHAFAYHRLKKEHFRRVVSANIRKRRRNFPILFINGARRNESENRKITMKNPIRVDGNDIWVNIINEFSKPQTVDLIEGMGLCRNPVSVKLCRSGECMCGTMQTEGDYLEAKYFYPEWGGQMDELRKAVTEKHGWDWGQQIPKHIPMERKGQLNMFKEFQPMCTDCKKVFESAES